MTLSVVPAQELYINHFIKIIERPITEIIVNQLKEQREVLKLDGLAAPQLGYMGIPIFVLKLRNDAGKFKKDDVIVCIDPKIIICKTEYYNAVEKCASIPNVKFLVSRPKCIDVLFFDLNGEAHNIELYNQDVGMWLHEYHHLLGVTLDQVGVRINV